LTRRLQPVTCSAEPGVRSPLADGDRHHYGERPDRDVKSE
jgi:hypothetical protein